MKQHRAGTPLTSIALCSYTTFFFHNIVNFTKIVHSKINKLKTYEYKINSNERDILPLTANIFLTHHHILLQKSSTIGFKKVLKEHTPFSQYCEQLL